MHLKYCIVFCDKFHHCNKIHLVLLNKYKTEWKIKNRKNKKEKRKSYCALQPGPRRCYSAGPAHVRSPAFVPTCSLLACQPSAVATRGPPRAGRLDDVSHRVAGGDKVHPRPPDPPGEPPATLPSPLALPFDSLRGARRAVAMPAVLAATGSPRRVTVVLGAAPPRSSPRLAAGAVRAGASPLHRPDRGLFRPSTSGHRRHIVT